MPICTAHVRFWGKADIEAVCFFYVSNSLANASAKAGSAKHHRI